MDTDVIRTDAAETSEEALAALERANTPPPPPVDPAVAGRQRAALRVVEALLREHTELDEVEAWTATRPMQRVIEGIGISMGDPHAECSRLIQLLNPVLESTQVLLMAPRRDRLERLVTQLAAAVDPVEVERLQGDVQRLAIEVRQARTGLTTWRANVQIVEDEVRKSAAALTAWLAESARARGGNA